MAEDLGFITPDVEALRRRFRLPGMRVLQFAFDGDPNNPHLPHMHRHNSVVYTGTHDNDTSVGWFASLDTETRRRSSSFCAPIGGSMPETLDPRSSAPPSGSSRSCRCRICLGLGSEARFNTPGTTQRQLELAAA